jgi:hypothetical protein
MSFLPWLVILPCLPAAFLVWWRFAMVHRGVER